MRTAASIVVLLCLAGCGGASSTPAKKAAPERPAATPASALVRYQSEFGISTLVPRGWKGDKDAKLHGTFFGGPRKKGAVAVLVEEKTDTPQEWLDDIVLSDKRIKVLARRKVRVPGLGKGIRATLRYPKETPQYELYVATIDGVFVEVNVQPDDQLTDAQISRILSSVRRKA